MFRSRETMGRGMMIASVLWGIVMARFYKWGMSVTDMTVPWMLGLYALAIFVAWTSGLAIPEFGQTIIKFDGFLQERVAKPFSHGLQGWLHINKFDLLRVGFVFEYAVIHCALAAMLANDMAHRSVLKSTLILGVFLLCQLCFQQVGGLRQVVAECNRCSQKYEDGTLEASPLALAIVCRFQATHRVLMNGPLLINLLFIDAIWWDKADTLQITAKGFGTLMLYTLIVMAHLVTTDNLHPKDRLRLKQPTPQRAGG